MNIRVNIGGTKGEAPREKYVAAKTRQLREFGYTDLTEKTVDEELSALLAGKPLTIIGKFMEGEVLK